ncbi:MAG TPA: chemotaxis protein CheW [Gemmatimonadaceae bacterium]|nr:chemotaxis protein CheW [Gemmatimonadaceae bacterium]
MKTDMVKLVTFQLGLDLFAADVFSVERVLRYTSPSAVPDVPEWIEGVIEHRGQVIPVVDMRRRIGLGDFEITPDTRVLVLTTADGWVGAIVDAVHEVASIPATSVTQPPALFRGLSAEFVRGIAKVRDQLIVVLDVDRVLTSAARIAFDRASGAGEQSLPAVPAAPAVAARA